MKKHLIERIAQKGSLMIEAMAMLGLIAMVTPMVYKKAAERTSELQDINEAGHIRIISRALDDYLRDNYNGIAASGKLGEDEMEIFTNYFPKGFSLDSKLFQTINFYVNVNEESGKKVLTGFLVAKPEGEVPLLRAARIASMIGANGGYADDGDDIKGTQGIWSIPKDSFDENDVSKGSIVTTSMQTIAEAAGGANSKEVLHKVFKDDPELNTMETALLMGNQDISGLKHLQGQSAKLDGAFTAGTATINGALAAGASTLASAIINTTLGVTGNTTLTGTLGVTGKTTLKELTADETTLGTTKIGAESGTGDQLTVSGGTKLDGTLAVSDTTLLGGATATSGDTDEILGVKGNTNLDGKLSVTDNSILKTAEIGDGAKLVAGEVLAVKGDTGLEGNLTVTENINTTKINALTLQGGKETLDTTDEYNFVADKDKVSLGRKDDGAYFVVADNKSLAIGKDTKIDDTNFVAKPTASFDIATKELIIDSDNFKADNDATAIKSKEFTVHDILSVEGDGYDKNNGTKNDVHVRKGILEIASDKAATGSMSTATGYVQADKLISNMGYASQETVNSGVVRDYDRYQVNPAYTSVMHDIKLSTRGGARLSDILPDYVNKGIYVLDTTFKEGVVWEDKGADLKPTECTVGDFTCVTSPWMGFIPKPQCPPGYSRVADINPLRFAMAQAYWVSDALDLIPAIIPEKEGEPLQFQGSTWLNISLQANSEKSGEFKGWHALMGFIYPAEIYQNFPGAVVNCGSIPIQQCTLWNLVPVYNQELAAIANVYCFFDRSVFGSDGRVDHTYDQLREIRGDFDKSPTSGYRDRLNDPTLGYKEVW